MSDDYISREAALKAIYTSTAPALEVKAMPAADVVEVRHGRWVDKNRLRNTYHFQYWICSCCGYARSSNWDWEKSKKPQVKYCENCGAKMDGGKEDI